MEGRAKIILDAGHGGSDPGAVYLGRQEKDDNLRLALAVGELLQRDGVEVMYTRVDDIYQTPFEKAEIGNRSGADYFISIHRNAMPVPGSASGAETLVYENSGVDRVLAGNINNNLVKAGLSDLGVIERPGLVVLRQTQMPAVLVEAGFIDSDIDNQLFDQNFDAIARAVADGILETVREEKAEPLYYQVQVGAYTDQDTASRQVDQLLAQGFPAFIVYDNGYYKVRVGAFTNMNYAVDMERRLRQYGYNTFMVRQAAVY